MPLAWIAIKPSAINGGGHITPTRRRGETIAKAFEVALVQASPSLGDKQANLEKMRKFVEGASADLFLFGELYLSGYMAKDYFSKLAETLDGPSVGAVADLAAKASADVIFGMPERDEETDVLYNSSVYVSQDGEVQSYRKLYPANFGPFEELQFFGRGDELGIVETDWGKIGLLICYDTFFPEVPKGLALRGAEVLACISAAPATSKPFFDVVIPARAVENTCFFLYSNIVGTELNMVFQGGTQAIGPRGEELARAKDFEEGVVTCTIDLRDAETAKRFRPTIRDTRPEVLSLLLEEAEGVERANE